MEHILVVLSAAVCRRFKGGAWFSRVDIDPVTGQEKEVDYIPNIRRYGSPFLFATLLMAGFPSWKIYAVAVVGFYAMDWLGTGKFFMVFHGWFDGRIEYSPLNRWVYKVSDILAGGGPRVGGTMDSYLSTPRAKHNALWAFYYGTFRGLYKAITSVGLAWVAGNPILALWGFLGMLDGVIYYTAGRIAPKIKMRSIVPAELVSGANYGEMIWRCLG